MSDSIIENISLRREVMNRGKYIPDELVIKRAKEAVAIELQKKKALNASAIVYDPATEKIYQLNSDGSRTPIAERLKKGRYSERQSQ